MPAGTRPGSDLLAGLTVAVSTRERALHFAGRCLSDHGARVYGLDGPEPAEVDQVWLGRLERLPKDAEVVDLVLAPESAHVGTACKCLVSLSSVSSRARNAGEHLTEPALAAAGGLAIAVGRPDQRPLPMPNGCLDALVGSHVAGAGIAGLLKGLDRVEVAAADVVAWAVATNLNLYLPYGLPWYRAGRQASGHGSCYPWALFDAADGLYCLIGRTARDWRSLVQAMGNPTWAKDPRFQDPRKIGREYSDLADAHVRPWVARQTRDELTEIMRASQFAGAPVLDPDEVLSAPSTRDHWRTVHCRGGEVKVPAAPFDVVPAPGARSPGPLHDLVVLDLSWVWSGPAVALGLGDLGATVIKVESSIRPDNSRMRGRPSAAATRSDGPELEMSPYFHALNRGKLSVSLDLRSDSARSVLRELADGADVIVENLSPGVVERWGVGPEAIQETNPGCTYLSMRGFPDHPTTAGLRAYAPTLSSAAGIESLVAYPSEPPVGAMSVAFSDAFAASQGILLCLTGLYGRGSSGVGSTIEFSQFAAAVLANGANIVARQLGHGSSGLAPLADDSATLTTADQLPTSAWMSDDLFSQVSSRWLQGVSVATLPWRQDGELPRPARAGPELGSDTRRVLVGRQGLEEKDVDELEAAEVLR